MNVLAISIYEHSELKGNLLSKKRGLDYLMFLLPLKNLNIEEK
jgi:hypothetical protein